MGIVAEVQKFEGVIKKDASAAKADLELLFGAQGVDSFLANAEAAGKTALGAIAKGVVALVEANLPGASGAVKQQAASQSIGSIAKAAGISAGTAIINQAIETFVPLLGL